MYQLWNPLAYQFTGGPYGGGGFGDRQVVGEGVARAGAGREENTENKLNSRVTPD